MVPQGVYSYKSLILTRRFGAQAARSRCFGLSPDPTGPKTGRSVLLSGYLSKLPEVKVEELRTAAVGNVQKSKIHPGHGNFGSLTTIISLSLP